jgi:hypothetical protein
MKKIIITILLLSILLSSCSVFPAPTPTPDIQMTIEAEAKVMVAQTLTAMPTNTELPTQTPAPTATAMPTETPLPTETPTVDPATLITPIPFSGTLTSGNTDNLPVGLLHIENKTGIPNVEIQLYGKTIQKEQWVYYAWFIERMMNVNILWAHYDYSVVVPGKSTFTGTFTQNNYDKTTFVITLKGVKITGP